MELPEPHIGLLGWTIISVFGLGLVFAALLMLIPSKLLSNKSKTVWTLIILLAPVAGAILFFALAGAFQIKKTGAENSP